ncbi:MAG: hypothetical protein FWF60_05000 [Oscillospiraceae bacterium]|nr:hypothetical protein [Oscillospiraceae bacterium]
MKLREWISVRIAKSPGPMVLLGIFLANLGLFSAAAVVISHLAPASLAHRDFWSCVFYTISMILDAGCVQYVVEDVGEAGVLLILVCLFTIIVGMVVFAGAVIGYMTNWISQFIENANSGARGLFLSDHFVILGWNSRASEIINDLLYKEVRTKIVVLVKSGKEDVVREIGERLSDTLEKEKKTARRVRDKLVVVVREGDICSTKQLSDISLSRAQSVIILSSGSSVAGGDTDTIKTLVQVAQITAAADSADNQQVIVEVEDDWTLALVNRVIEHKMRRGKCNIVPVAVNRVLGQILSQFSIMPELNMAYSALFSNKGASFFARAEDAPPCGETEFFSAYLDSHLYALPLSLMRDAQGQWRSYYMAGQEDHVGKQELMRRTPGYHVSLNPAYEIREKNIVVLGHSSKSAAIMEGFNAFRGEWQREGRPEILNIIVIDDEQSLERHDHYRGYPYVKRVIAAGVFERETICREINAFVDANAEDTSVLILSDDSVADDETDAGALTYLIYMQDIISERLVRDPAFDIERVDIVVEILNPKNYDIVHHYNADNIIISNRYISKLVTQIGEKEGLYDFYNSFLTYDDAGAAPSKEIYIKKASEFFTELPPAGSAADLVRAVFDASPEDNKAVVLGYASPGGRMVLFEGSQAERHVALTGRDKLILFSYH